MTTIYIENTDAQCVEDLVRVNRAHPNVAQHDKYLFWLCCTIYRGRCFIARALTAGIVGYLVSLPDSEQETEFLLQIAVLKEWRQHATGKLLLARHWQSIEHANVRRVRTSIHESCREGMALLRLARGMGHGYRPIEWPIQLASRPTLAHAEQLYEAYR